MSAQGHSTRKRILLADDHPVFLDGLKHLLQGEYEVVASLGRRDDFVAKAVAHRPDLIVADDELPQLDGLAALDTFATAGLKSKVVILTRTENTASAVHAVQRGVDAYVLKRVAAMELPVAIRSAFAGERWVSPALAVRIIEKLHDQPLEPNHEIAGTLSDRQLNIISGLVRGQIAKEIAVDLGISRKTVEYHKYKLMEQLRLRSTAELIQFAVRNGLDAPTGASI